MKTLLALSLMLTIPAAAVHADVCLKQKSHTEQYYYGGVTNPAEDEDTEMWIGPNKMAVISENTSIIVDNASKLMYFINHRDSTYAEIAMPMDWSQIVDQQLAGRLAMFKRQGEVKPTGETKKIGEWSCKEYEVVSYIPYMDTRFDERESKVWVTTDAPIDLAAYTEMTDELGKLRNYSDALIEEFKKLEGLPVASEGVLYMRGFTVNTSEQLLKMYEEKAPEGVYSVPKGYNKKDQLTMQDLRG